MYKTSILVQEYFSLNRITLLAIGLWPYQRSKFAPFQVALCLSIMTSFIIFMLSRLYVVEYSFEHTIQMFCVSTYFAFLLMNYISVWINIKTIRYLLEQLQDIYKTLKDSKEIAIYKEYGNIAKRLTLACIILAICYEAYIITIQCGPYILDIIIPKNVTYSRHLIVSVTTNFAVQEKDFYLFLLYLNTVATVGTVAIIAVGTMLFTCWKHICGVLRIVSYRFEQAITATLQSIAIKNEPMISKEFAYAVDMHRKAMKIAKIIMSDMEGSLLILIMITVICMSLNLCAILQVEGPMQDIEKAGQYFIIIIALFLYMFISNYAGQEVTDCNNHIFLTVYKAPWYLVPLKTQKLILFLLQRSNKTFTLDISGIFILSLESFASLVSASISYFTLMLSLQ